MLSSARSTRRVFSRFGAASVCSTLSIMGSSVGR